MKSKKRYTENDRVLVKSFAGPQVCVVLRRRYLVSKSKHKLGVDGWEAQITNQKEVEKLRKRAKSQKFGYLIGKLSKDVDSYIRSCYSIYTCRRVI